MIFKKYTTSLIIFSSFIIINAQDYDEIGEDRTLHRRKRPQYGGGGGGPCGRDVDGRFLSLQYVNYNYHVNCGGGGAHPYPQQDFLGGVGGGGHRPQKPHKPHKPHRPIFGGGGGGHGGNGGGFLGSHGGGSNGGGFLGSHGGNGGGLFGSNGGGLGGLFQGNRPQTIIQDAVSGIGDALNRPPFNQGGGNGGGLFGSGLFDGSIFNSFTSLFSNSNTNSNRPPSNDDDNVQFVQDNTNTNTNNNDNTNTLIDEKPVHEDQDEISEVYSNKLRRGEYIPGSPSYGSYHNPGYGYGGGYGGFNYNKAIKKVNRQINTALKPIYQLFRR